MVSSSEFCFHLNQDEVSHNGVKTVFDGYKVCMKSKVIQFMGKQDGREAGERAGEREP
jgi:hypothetical protein